MNTFRLSRMAATGVAMLKYNYQCADFFYSNVNHGVIRERSFQNTICQLTGMLNFHVPKSGFWEKNLYLRG